MPNQTVFAKEDVPSSMLTPTPLRLDEYVASALASWTFIFLYPENYFSLLCRRKSIDSFDCNVFQLAKHQCACFPAPIEHSFVPFYHINSDIWGPTPSIGIIGLGHNDF